MRSILSEKAIHVTDLYREWVGDESDSVSKKEFLNAMLLLSYTFPTHKYNELFDEWDEGKFGALTFSKFQKQLRHGEVIQLKAVLEPGAAGETPDKSVLESKSKMKLGVEKANATAVRAVDIYLRSPDAKPMSEQVLAQRISGSAPA